MNTRALLAPAVLACALLPSVAAPAPQETGGGSFPSTVPIVLLRRSEKPAPGGSGADVLVRANPKSDEIARRAAALMARPGGFAQLVLQLDRDVRRYLLRDASTPPAARQALEQPAFLFLSDREGGFPAESFWLEQPDGRLADMRNAQFVDMVVKDGDLRPGSIDGLVEIYAHELGHLMMASLAGPAPKRASNAMHFMTVRTDAWYAFMEGFGEHFQPMSVDHWERESGRAGTAQPASPGRNGRVPDEERLWYGRFMREQADGCLICPANLRFLRWHGRGEQRLRDQPLRANLFVHDVALPEPLRGDGRAASEVRMFRDVVPPSPDGAIRNGVQMMESEGVVATLFYRLASDERLRSAYREASFYESFLDEARAAQLRTAGVQAVIGPDENVYLKMFDVMHRSFRWGDWPAIELVRGYASRFPDEAAAVYDVFLDVTRGVTVQGAGGARRVGPADLEAMRDRLVAGRLTLEAGLGKAIWMVSPSMTFGMGLFRYFPMPSSHRFDLNAADIGDLRSVPGVSASLANAIIRARDGRGSFSSVNDLAGVPGMSPELLATFQAMAARMRQQLERAQPRGSDPGWVKNLMVPALRGSYYAAAAWQYGVALVLAGTAFAAIGWLFGARRSVARPTAESGRWRRARRAIGSCVRAGFRGMLPAAIPLAASVALYRLDVLPTGTTMAAVGAGIGLAAALAIAAFRPASRGWPAAARVTCAFVAASALIGLLY